MTWTDQHQAQAAAEGWGIFAVVEMSTRRISSKILSNGSKFRNSDEATRHVITLARARSAFHLFALKKVMEK